MAHGVQTQNDDEMDAAPGAVGVRGVNWGRIVASHHGHHQPAFDLGATASRQAACTFATGESRRQFLATLVGSACLVLLAPQQASAKKLGIKRSMVRALDVVGGSVQIKFRNKDVLLIRDTEKSVRALDPMCTHKKCMVRYQKDSRDIGCTCHASKFLLDGTVVSGPAPRPLTTYHASLGRDQIVISMPD